MLDSFPFCLFTYWVGSDAKWFDDCSTSDSVSVKIYTWNPVTSTQNTYWYGGSTITDTGCVKVVTENTVPFNKMAVNTLFGVLDYIFGVEELSNIPNEIIYVPGL